MATAIKHKRTGVGTAGKGVSRAALGDGGQPMAARLTTERVWHQVARRSQSALRAACRGHAGPQTRIRG